MADGTKDEKKIADKAAYWFALLRSGTHAPAQERAFELWISEDAQHQTAYHHLQSVWDGCDALSEDPEFLSIRRRALQPRQPAAWRAGAVAAACAFLILIVGAIGAQFWNTSPLPAADRIIADIGGVLDRQSRYYSTQVGERSNITLPDQSVVDLNTDTEIRTLFTDQERRIVLVRGQALFKVAHDADRPFSVVASGQVITALGTEFEVRLDQGEVAVTLLEGRVTVDELNTAAGGLGEEDDHTDAKETIVELAPGERIEVGQNGPPTISTPDVEKVIAWKDGVVSFIGEPLEEVVYEMNRYSETKIVIRDESLKQMPFGGTFKTGVTDSFIIAMTYNYPIENETDPETGEIILKWIESP